MAGFMLCAAQRLVERAACPRHDPAESAAWRPLPQYVMTFYPTGEIPPLAEATEPAFMASDIFHGFENFVRPIAMPRFGKRSQTHGRLERKRARPRVWDGPFLAQRTRWRS